MAKNLLLVAIGGAAGSVLRYLTSVFADKLFGTAFPWATLIANMAGCFLIGFAMGEFQKHNLLESNLKYLFATGFCGGYTTFSAFAFENVTLVQQSSPGVALVYIATSVLAGLASAWLGIVVSGMV